MTSLAPLRYNPPAGEISIIYHDDDILALDKPSGLLSVPGKSDAHKDCLESRIQADFPTARIVHRLDMDTSGLIIMALNSDAHRHLGLQFERRHIDKTYVARVWGLIADESGIIDLPLRCDWPNRPRQMVDFDEGRSALTEWEVVARDDISTRVTLYPKTGRSHQLRVHMLELGHPILGDNLYAHEEALAASSRLCLHAQKIDLYHPTGGARLSFEVECPF
ncbi:MAG: pseudouridine synthase [Hyphomicrobiales bacterium]